MPKGVTFEWHGARLADKVIDAVKDGIDDTLEDAADGARHRAPRKTGTLVRNITNEDAKHDRQSGEIVGFVGVREGVRYAAPVEAEHRFLAKEREEITGAKLAERIRARMRRPRVL